MSKRVMTESQLRATWLFLRDRKVTELKSISPVLGVPATWYNWAKKNGLVRALLFQIDRWGLNEDQFSFLRDRHVISRKFKSFTSLAEMEEGSHTTQYFVRGEQADFTKAESIKLWHEYFPRDWKAISKNGNTGYHSSTIMDQRFNPHRKWRGEQEDPDGLFENDGHQYTPPEPEPPRPRLEALEAINEITKGAKMNPESLTPIEPTEEVGLEAAIARIVLNSLGTNVEKAVSDLGVTKTSIEKLVEKIVHQGIKGKVVPAPDPADGGPSLMLVHKNYEAAEFYLADGYSVYLNGPAGSGKTVAVTQLADAFSTELCIISCHGEMTVYDLIGFTDATGTYKATEFYKAWRDGKIILLDEVDKAPGEVNVLLNAGLAQGTITFPIGTLKKQPSTKLVFTGNTKMSGADAIYSAGQRQDGSFSNRMVTVDWPFDETLERTLAETEAEKHGGTKPMGGRAYDKIIKIRKAIEELGMNYVVGQRQSMMTSKAIARGREEEAVFDEVVYGWMDPNDAKRVKERVKK